MNSDYKKIGLFGLSPRTGFEVIKYLSQFKIQIIAADGKSRNELKPLIKKIKSSNIKFDLESKGTKLLEADLIILSPGVPYDLDILKKARKKGIETISEIEFAFRESQAEIIAVTGTNGKTTTVELLGEMLSDYKNKKVKVAGNIGIPFISIVNELEAKELVILELSSFQLESIKNFKAKIALYLNYSPDHLDRHQTEKKYKKAKKNIFKNQTEADYALLNFDDPYLLNFKNRLKAKVLGIAKENKAADLIIDSEEVFYKRDDLKLIDFTKINLPGKHNKENIAFAALAAYLVGQDPKKIQKAAEKYQLKPHRMELIENEYEYLIINDSKATNPDSTIKAIQSIEREIVLIAGGQNRNADFSNLIQEIKRNVKTLILIGETGPIIAKKLKNSELEIIRVKTIEKAAAAGLKKLKQNNALLLSPACPSWDMFSNYKERGNLFKKAILNQLSKEYL